MLVNRVAASGIVTLNLEDYFPTEPLLVFDLKDYLFHGLILKEKDFREALKTHDWSQYDGKNLAIYCSADAIVPVWAFQLVSLQAEPFARRIVYGTPETFYTVHYHEVLGRLDLEPYRNGRVVIKGCSDRPVPIAAYTELARLLRPIVASLMYGEPCSTVPLFKKTKTDTPT